MKSMVFPLAASLLAGATSALAQYQPGVYLSSQEYAQNSPSQPGVVSDPGATPTYLEVVHANTYAVHRVPRARAWGYANPQGQSFRLVDNKPYCVQPQQNGLVIYSRQHTTQQGRYAQVITEQFYSQGLDGPLRPLTKRALRQQLALAQ
jgi:hypothetical protein